ncbi:MAG: phosphoribosyltransferase [Chloroflexi bacterium]|nr:phosphoribosyltransferase [Chloroflexota bacterium]
MQEGTSLWLARALYDVGGIQFGDFTLGETAVNSPVYVNPRLLVSEPTVLASIARLIEREVRAGQARRRPRISPFSLVAGVPLGGLHLATAFSLLTEVPMIYARPTASGGRDHIIEGRYEQGQTVLVIDDLITGGGSIIRTGALLEEAGLTVRDAIVLVDREQGAADRLRNRGYNLIPILKLKTMLTYYYETGLIEKPWFERSIEYLERNRRPAHD